MSAHGMSEAGGLREALGAHVSRRVGNLPGCSCGETYPGLPGDLPTPRDWHLEHLVTVLAAPEADPTAGETRWTDASTSASEPLSEDERKALEACRSAGSLDHALIPDDTFATVAVLLAAREAKARAEAGEQALLDAADDLHSQGLPIAAYRLRDRAARIGREVTS